ncbi:MAG: endonuclease Q family protein [Candidatus Methanofastidiosia archaeon]|jgi:PHP family Zn ribbon phosphoesterase
MYINADLHAHSGYAGGVGKISFAKIDDMMSLKGIDIVGTGDCLHPQWLEFLKNNLKESTNGIFTFEERRIQFVLQTEVIFTCKIKKGRKTVHTVLLFPSFDAVDHTCELLEKWGVKNTIGRPFIVCDDNTDVSHKLYTLTDIDSIEVIPAHVLTPDGIYGSNRPITYLHEFFGDFSGEISAIETGLSADPQLLQVIPELQDKTWISNSDAHSHHLHRMGREFTTLDIPKVNYPQIINSIKTNKVVRTAEFNPAEGRYFLTGHRKNRKGHNNAYCYYAPGCVPENHLCPICSKPLTIGVLERAVTLKIEQSSTFYTHKEIQNVINTIKTYEGKRNYVHMIPLAEIIAKSLNIKTITAKKVFKEYKKIVELVGCECDLWFNNTDTIKEILKGNIKECVYDTLIAVKQGNFGFYPPGFDGVYGELALKTSKDVTRLCEVCTPE